MMLLAAHMSASVTGVSNSAAKHLKGIAMLPSEDELSDEELAWCIDLCNRVRDRYKDALDRCRFLEKTDLRERRIVPSVGIFPPVTRAQLDTAEVHIGFRLPALLRLLYMTVANGCFAPDRPGQPGLGDCLGIAGGNYSGYPYPCPQEHRKTIEDITSHCGWRLEPETERRLIENHQDYALCLAQLPDGFVEFCDAGCSGSYALDLYTGYIYLADCYEHPFPEAGEAEFCTGITYVCASLDELVESWLSNKYIIRDTQAQQEPACLGIYGATGLTPATAASLDENQAPSDDERLDDDFFDSDDWKWYLQQPPMDPE